MKVGEAYEKSWSPDLADTIWSYKHPGEPVDSNDREYASWRNSTRIFLRAAVNAGLSNLDVVFELPTPLGDYIDVAILGSSRGVDGDESGRLLIVELKQWSVITQTDDENYVEISVGNGLMDKRRHPVSQICEYESHMSKNHYGIYKNGRIRIDTLAYLHNFSDKQSLLTDVYSVWSKYADKVFCCADEQRLVTYLKDTFSDKSNNDMAKVIDHCGYVMDEAGFSGLKSALHGEENATMVKDQMSVVDCVRTHLELQKKNPHKEIIVISGGPGTGKTIIGMHFIYDYTKIFNEKSNADGAVFCLPKSKTVKAMIDYECHAEVVPYLDRINRNQNLVVVDEAHRITGLESTLNSVFAKETKLLVMLQDDHQRIRPGEDGTVEGIKAYADEKGIEYTQLSLTIQKRCESLGRLLDGLEKMFYGEGKYDGNSISSVKFFERLQDMNTWIENLAEASRAKLIAPFCWKWTNRGADVQIDDNGVIFQKAWNPKELGDQIKWHYGRNRADQIASIYTCQGLDLDDVAFIWWKDLVWDETEQRWKSNITESKDTKFVNGVTAAGLSREEIDTLFLNTYYVMLSRARNKMGIWFQDEATKRHVMASLGLKPFSEADAQFVNVDKVNTVHEEPEKTVIGNKEYKIYHIIPTCKYAPGKGNREKRVEFASVAEAVAEGYKPCRNCNH
jgi:hypothetical protein